MHKEFRGGGGSKGVLGVGSKVQFWGPISLCLCACLGLEESLFFAINCYSSLLVILVDVSEIFILFLLQGWEGESRRQGRGGGRFFIESPRRGGARVPAGNLGGGGGVNIIFSGPKCPPSNN